MTKPDRSEEALATQYITALGLEWDAKWLQGDQVAAYVEEVFPWSDQRRKAARDAFFKRFAKSVGQSPATVRNRERTSRFFPNEDERSKDHSWTIHLLCAKHAHNPGQALALLHKVISNGWGQGDLEVYTSGGHPRRNIQTRKVRVVGQKGNRLLLDLDKPLDAQAGDEFVGRFAVPLT